MKPSDIANILDMELDDVGDRSTVLFERECDAQAFAELCDEFTNIDVKVTEGRSGRYTHVTWTE